MNHQPESSAVALFVAHLASSGHSVGLMTLSNSSSLRDRLNWRFFASSVAVFLLAAVLLVLAWFAWGSLFGLGEPRNAVGRATAALTTVGALGASVYIVLRYRSQSLAERGEARDVETHQREALVNATRLLDSDVASTRIAGVLILTEIADTYGGKYIQQVVSILTGYLRTKHSEDESGHDRAVESTILQTIEEHVQADRVDDASAGYRSWSRCSFNFEDAELWTRIRISGARFDGEVNFSGAMFNSFVVFEDTVFRGDLLLEAARFKELFVFRGVRVDGTLDADYARFESIATLIGSTVGGDLSLRSSVFEFRLYAPDLEVRGEKRLFHARFALEGGHRFPVSWEVGDGLPIGTRWMSAAQEG